METTSEPTPAKPENPTRLKQKIWMIAAVMEPLGRDRWVMAHKSYPSARAATELAQEAFRAGDMPRARLMAEEALAQTKECAGELKKTARKLVGAQLKKIAKY